jgi:putative FmdB family regulatory protein
MPRYDYYCDACQKEVTLTMTMSEHDTVAAACPECQGRPLRPLVGAFFARTSRKS